MSVCGGRGVRGGKEKTNEGLSGKVGLNANFSLDFLLLNKRKEKKNEWEISELIINTIII